MTCQWMDCDPDFIAQRYDRLADIIPFFDWLFFVPAGLRKHAVDRLSLKHGDCVLDVGCGTGRNFPFLREAIGPTGRIYGVDLSAGMLRKARKLRDCHHWINIHLTEEDAANYVAPEPLDGVLFSLSYNTMPHHLTVLRRSWKQLRPGGRLVIMDSKLPPGLGGKLLLPFSLWMMRHTLLGNPYIRPWEHHAELVDDFEMEEFLFASYYVCRGVKPVKSLHGVRAPSQRRTLAARPEALGRLRCRLEWRRAAPRNRASESDSGMADGGIGCHGCPGRPPSPAGHLFGDLRFTHAAEPHLVRSSASASIIRASDPVPQNQLFGSDDMVDQRLFRKPASGTRLCYPQQKSVSPPIG
jgi:ubiquinone/menaquinone biosynthesis C-methylase UbiE